MRYVLVFLVSIFLSTSVSFSQEGADVIATTELPASEEVLVTEDTSVTLPAGEEFKAITDGLVNALVPVVLGLLATLLALAPGYVKVILGLFLTEKNIRLAIQFAINKVPGASSDKPLTIDVGNEVVAKAAQYFVDSVPSWLVKWLGGPTQIQNKVLSRINLDANAGDPRHVTNRR